MKYINAKHAQSQKKLRKIDQYSVLESPGMRDTDIYTTVKKRSHFYSIKTPGASPETDYQSNYPTQKRPVPMRLSEIHNRNVNREVELTPSQTMGAENKENIIMNLLSNFDQSGQKLPKSRVRKLGKV